MNNLFGTSGIRGSSNTLFTNQFCFDIGRAFSLFLDKHKAEKAIAIGMDPRGSSPRIKQAVISGLLFEKREVYDEGASPIPAINQILKTSSQYDGSIMISGSHIKADLNGIKFFAFDNEILKEHEEEIAKIYESIKNKVVFRNLKTDINFENKANNAYQEYLLNFVPKTYPKWKVVVDCGNGAQSDTMPQILKGLGLKVIEDNCTIQGEFFARDTEVESNMLALMQSVMKERADFGIGYDADGDRVVFIDEKGKFIPGDYTGTILAKNIPGNTIVTPINCSQVIDKIGKKIIRTKVGSPFVVSMMRQKKASFGFEANGGGIFSEMLSRDGGRTTIEVLNILAREGKTMSSLISQLPKYYIYRDKVEYKWEFKDKIIKSAMKHFKGIRTEKIDGLKIWLDNNTWILFRSSQNAPEFRVFTESKSDKKAKDLLINGLNLVKQQIS